MKIYKLIGDENSITLYIEKHKSNKKTDWTGTYFQTTIDNALSCYGYRIDQKYKEMNLIEIEIIDSLDILIVNGKFIYNPKINGNKKAEIIKSNLNIEKTKLLCDYLKENNTIIKCLEFENEYEIFIPHDLHFIKSEKIINTYYINKKMELSLKN